MRKFLLPLVILLFLFMTVRIPAQNAQVSPVAGLNQQNTSVVNNNLQILQTGINGVLNQLGTVQGYFTGGILGTANGGTGKNFSAVSANAIPYFSATGVMGNIGIGTTGYYLAAGSPPYYTPPIVAPTYFANQNIVTGSRNLTSIYHNTSGHPMLVMVNATAGADYSIDIKTDTSS